MDQNVIGLAKLLIRGRRGLALDVVAYIPYEKEDVLACDFFRAVIKPQGYTAERKSQFAELLVYKAKQLQRNLPKNFDKRDDRYLSALQEMEKVIMKFLRTYPKRYTKVTFSNI